jgi:hypothetical protein
MVVPTHTTNTTQNEKTKTHISKLKLNIYVLKQNTINQNWKKNWNFTCHKK